MNAIIALLAAAIVFSLLLYALFIPTGYASGTSARSGLARFTDTLDLNGHITGYADLPGPFGTVRVDNPVPSPDRPGAVRVPFRLASFRLNREEGTGADPGNAMVLFTGPAGTEVLTGSSGLVLKRFSRAVIQKGSLFPGQAGNGNMLLEPNEVFVLFIYPSASLPPRTPFSVTIAIPRENSFTVSRVVPATFSPAMDHG